MHYYQNTSGFVVTSQVLHSEEGHQADFLQSRMEKRDEIGRETRDGEGSGGEAERAKGILH